MQERPHLRTPRDWIRQILNGMCMGAADLVPGISGGTVALILGIYEKLIYSLRTLVSCDILSLFRFQFSQFSRSISWDFLLGLLVGMLLSFGLFSQVIQWILNNPIYRKYLYAFFIGMIISSALLCVKRISIWKRGHVVAFALGVLGAVLISGSSSLSTLESPRYDVPLAAEKVGSLNSLPVRNYDTEKMQLLDVSKSHLSVMLSRGYVAGATKVIEYPSGLKGKVEDFVEAKEERWLHMWLVISGSVAVCAMLLPGVSGSYVLTMLGVYPIVIGALADFFRQLDFDAFIILSNVGLGIALGAVLFSQFIAYLLKRHHDNTMAVLIGCMVGALGTAWPFYRYDYALIPTQIDKGPQLFVSDRYIPSLGSMELYGAVAVALLGFALILGVSRFVRSLD